MSYALKNDKDINSIGNNFAANIETFLGSVPDPTQEDIEIARRVVEQRGDATVLEALGLNNKEETK